MLKLVQGYGDLPQDCVVPGSLGFYLLNLLPEN